MKLLTYLTLLLSFLLTACVNGKYENFDAEETPVLKVDANSTQDQIEKYLLTQYKDAEIEQVRVVLYDKNGKFISTKVISEGSTRTAQLKLVDIHRYALQNNSTNIAIYHNHVDQWFARPSVADRIAYNEITEYAHQFHLNIKSIILSKRDAYEQPNELYHIPAEPIYTPDGMMGTFSTKDNWDKRHNWLIDAGYRNEDTK